MITGSWIARSVPVVLSLGLAWAQQTIAPEKASISGVVTGTDGKPLRRATVHLGSSIVASPDSPNVIEFSGPSGATETDADGNFAFEGLAPGGYSVSAERAGYLVSMQTVRITAGQNVTGVAIQLTAQSIVAGRVMDDEGEILPGATVKIDTYAIRKECAFCISVGPVSGTTDADGAFSIGGLRPGRYAVSVTPPPSMTPAVKSKSSDRRKEVYVTTYYPDAIDRADATPVVLAPGAQARGLELKLQKSAVFKIRGKVVNAASGEPTAAENLSLLRQGTRPPGLSARSVAVSSDGEFAFSGILPGNYLLEAKSAAEAEDRPAMVAWQMLSIANDDLDGVVVEMKPALEVGGKVVVEGASLVSPPRASSPRITLTPVDGMNTLDSATVDSDGQFRVKGAEPALYSLTVVGLPPGQYVKAMRFNGAEIHGPMDLGSSPSGSLEIVVSRGTLSLSGVVSDSNGPVGRGIPVFAMSGEGLPFGITATDEKGQFSMRGLAAGEYRALAMDSPGMVPPEFILKIGTPVTVAEGGTFIDLKLTTSDDLKAAPSGLVP